MVIAKSGGGTEGTAICEQSPRCARSSCRRPAVDGQPPPPHAAQKKRQKRQFDALHIQLSVMALRYQGQNGQRQRDVSGDCTGGGVWGKREKGIHSNGVAVRA